MQRNRLRLLLAAVFLINTAVVLIVSYWVPTTTLSVPLIDTVEQTALATEPTTNPATEPSIGQRYQQLMRDAQPRGRYEKEAAIKMLVTFAEADIDHVKQWQIVCRIIRILGSIAASFCLAALGILELRPAK